MDLVRQRGEWKVDNVQALGFTGSQSATPAGAIGFHDHLHFHAAVTYPQLCL